MQEPRAQALIPLLARVFDGLQSVETVIVAGPGDATALGLSLIHI